MLVLRSACFVGVQIIKTALLGFDQETVLFLVLMYILWGRLFMVSLSYRDFTVYLTRLPSSAEWKYINLQKVGPVAIF